MLLLLLITLLLYNLVRYELTRCQIIGEDNLMKLGLVTLIRMKLGLVILAIQLVLVISVARAMDLAKLFQ